MRNEIKAREINETPKLQADPIDIIVRLRDGSLSKADIERSLLNKDIDREMMIINAEYGMIILDNKQKYCYWVTSPSNGINFTEDFNIVTDEEAQSVLG